MSYQNSRLRTFLIPAFLVVCLSIKAQRNFTHHSGEVVKFIERNLTASDSKKIGVSSEFFIYDFTLDSLGSITGINILFLDSLSNISEVRKVGEIIQNSIMLTKSKYKKLLVPVLIIHTNSVEGSEIVNSTADVFDIFSNNKFNKVFVSRKAIITRYE